MYFYPPEVVGRGSETQLQVGKKLNRLAQIPECEHDMNYIIWGRLVMWLPEDENS